MPVKRLLCGQTFDVPEVSGGAALPTSFLMGGGVYAAAGSSWDMTQPGVYFIFNPANQQATRRAVTTTDPLDMASVFATIVRHSARDNALTFAQLDTAAKNRFVGLTCGVVAPWMKSWMVSAGWQARLVRFLTMETPNAYSNGHVAVEVRRTAVPYPWTLVDADLARYYEDSNGDTLSALEFVQAVPAWNFTIQPLADQNRLDAAPPTGSFDYGTTYPISLGTPAAAQEWTQRICQAVGIDAANGNTYWLLPVGSENRKAWVEAQSALWKVDTDPAVWMARFYP